MSARPHIENDGGALVKSVSIENMVNQRKAVLDRIGKALDQLTEAREIALSAGIGFPRFKLDDHKYSVYNMLDRESRAEAEEKIGLCIDAMGWQHLMNESGLRTLMDAGARKEWDDSIEKSNFPPFTIDNIKATFAQMYGARGDMFERGVLTVFRYLSWCYKTNKPFAFGKRIVLTHLRSAVSVSHTRYIKPEKRDFRSLGYLNHDCTDKLDDLVRVLSILDGKPEPDHRKAMHSAISQATCLDNRDVDTEYLHVRCFRNGNGHVTFKRPDLVEKMNAILTKHYPGALAHDTHERSTEFAEVRL